MPRASQLASVHWMQNFSKQSRFRHNPKYHIHHVLKHELLRTRCCNLVLQGQVLLLQHGDTFLRDVLLHQPSFNHYIISCQADTETKNCLASAKHASFKGNRAVLSCSPNFKAGLAQEEEHANYADNPAKECILLESAHHHDSREGLREHILQRHLRRTHFRPLP